MAYKVGAEALREWVPSQVEAPVWSPSISVQRHRPFFFLYITVTLLYDIAYSGFHTGLEMADFFFRACCGLNDSCEICWGWRDL